MFDQPVSTKVLAFDETLSDRDLEKVRDNLSAVAIHGEFLWLGGDEGTTIHRMSRLPAGGFGQHRQFPLSALLDLPGPPKEEIDIEGLSFDGGYLWLVGSHSTKRKKADPAKSPEENIARLGTIEAEGNRFILARIPLDTSGVPVAKYGELAAARLKGDRFGNELTEALKRDTHLAQYVPAVLPSGVTIGAPSKENGFDVEGLAVSGNRVFVGLRGPVLRGWAIVLELRVKSEEDGRIGLEQIGEDSAPYLKHFLRLDGLGIRDLVIDGDDILALAGPTMDLDGPVYVYRWPMALKLGRTSLSSRQELARIIRVPFFDGSDHAEGMTCVNANPLQVLLCYDTPRNDQSPGSRVVAGGRGVIVDIFDAHHR